MMENPKLKAALMGGGLFGVLAALPYIGMLNQLCCALFIGGGVLAVYLYFKEEGPFEKAPYGDGALVGALAGVIGGVVTALVAALVLGLGIGPDAGAMAEAFGQVEQAGVEVPGFVYDVFGVNGVNTTMLVGQIVLNVVLYAIFATIGALAGVAIFQKRSD